MRTAGLILAGGASTRMGFPKPLLKIGSVTFLQRLISVFDGACGSVIVVLGYQHDRVLASLDGLSNVTTVINPHPEQGQLSSLQCGLRALPSQCQAVLFSPVDYPAIQASTVLALPLALVAGDALLAVPRHQGKHGHPICASGALIDEFLALDSKAQARDVIHRHRDRTVYVDVNDPGTVNDVDNRDDYLRLTAGEVLS